jgi:hypothetical protein
MVSGTLSHWPSRSATSCRDASASADDQSPSRRTSPERLKLLCKSKPSRRWAPSTISWKHRGEHHRQGFAPVSPWPGSAGLAPDAMATGHGGPPEGDLGCQAPMGPVPTPVRDGPFGNRGLSQHHSCPKNGQTGAGTRVVHSFLMNHRYAEPRTGQQAPWHLPVLRKLCP